MYSSTAVAKVMGELDTFDGILIDIFKYLHVDDLSSSGQRITNDDDGIITIIPRKTQDDIIVLTLVSKRFHRIISTQEENGTKYWDIIPVLEIAPPPPSSGRVSSVSRFVNKLRDMPNAEIVNKQHFRHLIMNNIHEINNDVSLDEMNEMIARNGQNSQLKGIRSIQIVPHRSVVGPGDIDHFVRYILSMTTNAREINVSSNNVIGLAWAFFNYHVNYHGSTIETIRWDNIHFYSGMELDGYLMSGQNNLKQIFMDESIFRCGSSSSQDVEFANFEEEGEDEADNNNNDNNNENNNDENDDEENVFIFHCCCEKLERVSIRNAQYVDVEYSDEEAVIAKSVTQKALIKFVRNAPPTLQWFRSDLSPENMEMLRLEFLNIEFLN